MFFVGQKVMCVNDRNWPGGYRGRVAFPVRGQTYTVRAIVPTRLEGWNEDGVLLAEIRNPSMRLLTFRGTKQWGEVVFRMSRFRPLRATNIDVLLEMLEPVPAGQLELVT